MHISAQGRNKISKKELKYLTRFVGELLLGKRLSNNVHVTIISQDFVTNTWGICSPMDFDYKNHREFEILLNRKISKKKQLITLCHELVHLKQYARNELRDTDRKGILWLGKQYSISEKFNLKEYLSRPWEAEANQKETVLYEEYKNHLKENGIKFQ